MKQKIKRIAKPQNWTKIGFVAIFIWLIGLTIYLAIFHHTLFKLFEVESTNQMTNRYAVSAFKLPVIDIAESRVYIPEIKAYLPLNDTTRDLRYTYNGMAIDFSLQSLIGFHNPTTNDERTPIACLAMVRIMANNQEDMYKLFGELDQPLGKDGLKYVKTQKDCSDHNKTNISKQQLAAELLKLQPY